MCSGPESLVTKTSHSEISETSSLREVFPARRSLFSGMSLLISCAIPTSFLPPKITTLPLVSFTNQFATSANLSGNHLLVEPYSAPGFIPKTGRFMSFKRFLADNLSSRERYMYGAEYSAFIPTCSTRLR